ncbi:hypothetical protein HDV01_001974, partial [Terramyces sp. JEL0728]
MTHNMQKSLPVELWDRIWLLCDKETLENTRELQSEYVKRATEHFVFNEAARNGNLEIMKWLKENN